MAAAAIIAKHAAGLSGRGAAGIGERIARDGGPCGAN